MADPSFRDYDSDPELNKNGTSPKRMPEGNYKGSWVNDTFRWMAAVIRRLGDAAAKLPLDSDGAPDTSLGENVGTLAFQNANAVSITGGMIACRGYVPVGAVISLWALWEDFLAQADDLLGRGFAACDGRTVTNPDTGINFTLPDFRGKYPYFFDDTSTIGTTFGDWTHATTVDGAHAHANANTSAASGGPSLNVSYALVSTGGGGSHQVVENVTINNAATHVHNFTTPTGGAHQHTVDVTPPSISLIPLMRVW